MAVVDEVAVILGSLCDVWDEESVDELDHALQSAARALDDNADDELVLAAALHDLAHSPLIGGPAIGHHDRIAREWLTPRLGERVGWLAGAHVAAKRFLVATEPGYGAALSATSAGSLQAQGGAWREASWASHPWWPDALRLRRYDDAAKVPGATSVSVGQILAIAQRVLVAKDAGSHWR